MDKFRDITGVNNQMGFQTNKFDVDNLNQRYNDLINRFQQQMFVTKETRNIGDELKTLQREVSPRLENARLRVRELDEKYKRSIIDKSEFDLEEYRKAKEEAFKLDSLSRTLDERVSGIENSFMFKR